VSFRARLALVAAAAVALAVVAASAVVYVVVRDQLRGQVDNTLRARWSQIQELPRLDLEDGYLRIPGPPVGEATFVQAVTSDGHVFHTPGPQGGSLPVTKETLEATHGPNGKERFDDVRNLRVLTISGSGIAIQIARNLGEVNHTLHRITFFLIVIALGGIAVAAGLGLAVSQAALRPVRRLTDTAENVTETGDLSQRIEPGGEDELGRLAASFNTMLGALEESSRAQRQLVADASHELRTPLTSLRTNIEVLAGERSLAADEREKLLSDVVEQLGEMTSLIAELIELARAEQHPEEAEDVRLDLLAEGAVERAQRNQPNVKFTTDFEASLVHGAPSTIERAVANLLDNAAKWSPPGGEVEVGVHGAEAARGLPGSGLGLAIVKQVAEAHGGTVVAERPEDGGTLMRLRLNGRPS
jgi:two-component system sensor histidine kinase MprB